MKRLLVGALALAVLLVSAGFLSAATACAHDPRFACSPRGPADSIVISDASKSRAFYGRLGDGETDYYSVASGRGMRVPVSILLDGRDAQNPARPMLTVYDSSGAQAAQLDLSHPSRFFEPFSRVQYLTSGVREIALPSGISTLVVSMHGGARPQRYAVSIGSREELRLLDLPYLAGAILRIQLRGY